MENIIISIIGIIFFALAGVLAWCAYRNHRKQEGPWHRFAERYSFIGMWYFGLLVLLALVFALVSAFE